MRTVQFTLLLIILMAALMIAGCAKTAEQAYSWDTPHARVLPQGDLQWAPHPFVFKVGDSVQEGDIVAEMEAMKMQYQLKATRSGKVEEIFVKEGEVKDVDAVILSIAEEE